MPTVIITGGTGLIGKKLTQMLTAKSYDVILFSHKQEIPDSRDAVITKRWNINTGQIDKDSIARADYIIHLAGANVAAKRWTKKRKEEIRDSRTKSGALLVTALREIPNNVKAVVSASAIGWYGEDTSESRKEGFSETDLPATDFLGETTRLWEESIQPVTSLNKRLVVLRTGIVLSKEGGALKEFIKPLNFRIATILGKGNQMISWIHINDVCRLYIYAIENPDMSGVYNAVTALPVSNKELVTTLAKEMHSNVYLPITVPAFALQLALGEMSVEVLKGATISGEKTLKSGFTFLYPDIKSALHEIIKK